MAPTSATTDPPLPADSLTLRINIRAFGAELKAAVPHRLGDAMLSAVNGLIDLEMLAEDLSEPTLCCIDDGRGMYVLYSGREEIATASTADVMASRVLSEAEHLLAATSVHFTVVHAGVVAIDGELLLLPGRSHAGKTTAVRALLESGAVYYSDDYALVSPEGLVSPYPRPLGIRDAGTLRHRRPDELGASIGRHPASVRTVVFTEFRGGSTFEPVAMSRGSGVLNLLNHSLQAQTDPGRCLRALEAMSQTAIFLEGARGEAAHFVQSVLDIARRHG
jgi:hypothetical protein